MKIFVSHALTDASIIEQISACTSAFGIELLVAEHCIDLDRTVTEKIEMMIESCDLAIVLLTENGFDSNFVQQEIGYIKRSKKQILPIVQAGLEQKIKGFIFGRDVIKYDPSKPDLMLLQLTSVVMEAWAKLKEKMSAEDESRQNLQIVIGLGVLVVLLYFIFKK